MGGGASVSVNATRAVEDVDTTRGDEVDTMRAVDGAPTAAEEESDKTCKKKTEMNTWIETGVK